MAIREERLAQGDAHVMLAGDLNAEPRDLPALWELLEVAGWADVGAQPTWARTGTAPTCFAQGAKYGTNKDFFFVDPFLLPTVQGFKVLPELFFPVHLPLQLTLVPDQAEVTVYRAAAPMAPLGYLGLMGIARPGLSGCELLWAPPFRRQST